MLTYMKLHNVIVLLKFGFCECLLWLSIAIGREGGVAPLISLAHSDFEVSMVLLFLDSFRTTHCPSYLGHSRGIDCFDRIGLSNVSVRT